MSSILSTHKQIFQFIIKEIKIKRTLKERLKVLGNLISSYFKFWGQELKSIKAFILDKDYRETLKKKSKQEQLRKEFYRALQLLNYLDVVMKKKGYPQWKIQQTWNDFKKNQNLRKEIFDELLNEVKK